MHDSKVAVDGHYSEAENAGELVNRVHGQHQTAHEGPKRPGMERVLDRQERQTKHEELVSDGQVQDVNVSYRLDLRIVEDNVND